MALSHPAQCLDMTIVGPLQSDRINEKQAGRAISGPGKEKRQVELQTGNLGELIHLALTPAFLLIGAGGFLRVLTNRLARIIDRTRKLEGRTGLLPPFREVEYREEIAVLVDRKRIILYAIGLCGACALLVCLVIVTLFLFDLWNIGQDLPGRHPVHPRSPLPDR